MSQFIINRLFDQPTSIILAAKQSKQVRYFGFFLENAQDAVEIDDFKIFRYLKKSLILNIDLLKGPKVAYPTAEEYVHYSYLLFCNFQTMPVSMPFHPLDFVRYSSTVHYWISQVCHYLFAVVYCVRIWAISKLRYFIYIPKCFYLSGIEEFQMFYCLYVEALLKSCKK